MPGRFSGGKGGAARFTLAVTLLAVSVLAACLLLRPATVQAKPPADPAPVDASSPAAHLQEEPLRPLPQALALDPAKVALGGRLFADTRLSHDNTMACAGCHDLGKGGVDRRPHSVGIHGAVGGINAPTVLNSGLNFVQFWNGRAATLEDQVNGPTHNPKEMGSNWPEIVGKLRADPQYPPAFAALYPDGVQPANIRDAIATFERSLTTPDSRFDRYLGGETSALTPTELKGYHLFKDYGCIACHQGVNIGGNLYQKFGIFRDYIADRGNETEADLGRFAVTHRPQDRNVFRVPSLRNVALTAPYFHDGSAAALPQAVEIMAIYQLGRPLDARQNDAIVQFLKTLTGRQPGGRP